MSEAPDSTPRRAAQYVRMSTEHQQYSTQNQSDKIREYAERRGLSIIRTYADEGKSGLSIGGRAALQQLIADVESGAAEFKVILVYDVSRWGRFQDADESAYYEYICRRAGIQVAYCAEQFENDGSPVSTIVKGVKRAMAGEYSRELSAKVFAGQCRLIELGFRQGGVAGYGLRRVLLDQNGTVKAELQVGEQKSLQTDRVVLMPGPAEEIEHVHAIYRWLIEEDLSLSAIAERLNRQQVRNHVGTLWTGDTVREILTNEKYIGHNVYNRRSFKLKKLRVKNPPDMWIRKPGAFEGIVAPETFLAAQNILIARASRLSDDELLARLSNLLALYGTLSGPLIDRCPDLPSAGVVGRRFGSLAQAYERVGFDPGHRAAAWEINRRLRRLHPEIVSRTEQKLADFGGEVWRDPKTDLLHLNQEVVISLVLARCQISPSGAVRWRIRFEPEPLMPDITLAVRLDVRNEAELDYYLLPNLDLPQQEVHLSARNEPEFACFRFDDLSFFYGLSERASLQRKR